MLLPDGGFLNCPNARVTASSFADYYRFNPLLNTPDLLGDIKLPVLVVVGDADEVVPDLVSRMQSVTGAKSLEFEVVEGADHFFRDLYVEDLTEKVVNFIKKKRKQ